jgi:hypothetical protein
MLNKEHISNILTTFVAMKRSLLILFVTGLLSLSAFTTQAQQQIQSPVKGIVVRACVYNGDTIPCAEMRQLYVYAPLHFRNKRAKKQFDRLVRDVKKTLPIAKLIHEKVEEADAHLQTIHDKKERKAYIKETEKQLKKEYTPVMKKLTFSQGKLLIRLVDRECEHTSYELVKTYMGTFKAIFYQAFASVLGASLKKEYDPEDRDKVIERVIVLVENGQL